MHIWLPAYVHASERGCFPSPNRRVRCRVVAGCGDRAAAAAGGGRPGRAPGAGGSAVCLRRATTPDPALDGDPRRRRPRDRPRGSPQRGAARRRPARRGALHDRASRCRTSSRSSRRRGCPPPRRPRSGCPSTTTTSTSRCAAGRRQPDRIVANEMRRDSNDHLPGTTTSRSSSTRSTTGATASLFEVNAARRPHRRPDHQRAAVQHRLEPVWERQGRAVRGRLDGRDGHSVQVAALPARAARSLGLQRAPRQPVEERVVVPDARCPTRSGSDGDLPDVARGDARGPRGAAALAQPRDQAVRDRRT